MTADALKNHAERIRELADGIAQSDTAGLSDLQRAKIMVVLESLRGHMAKTLDVIRSPGTQPTRKGD